MTTTANLETRAAVRFGDTGLVVVTDWLPYLQEAYDEGNAWSPFWPWKEVRTTTGSVVSGTNVLASPILAFQVLAVHNTTDSYVLTPLEGHSEYRAQYPDLTVQGSPVNYRLFNNSLEFYPTADHTITVAIDYYAIPAALSHASGSPVWPDQFHHILIDGAMSAAYQDDGNEKFAADYRARFEAGLMKMEEALLSGTRTEAYPLVVDNWW